MKIKLIFYNHEELFKNINVDNVSELESMLNETIPTWVSLMTPLGVKYSRKKIDLLELELCDILLVFYEFNNSSPIGCLPYFTEIKREINNGRKFYQILNECLRLWGSITGQETVELMLENFYNEQCLSTENKLTKLKELIMGREEKLKQVFEKSNEAFLRLSESKIGKNIDRAIDRQHIFNIKQELDGYIDSFNQQWECINGNHNSVFNYNLFEQARKKINSDLNLLRLTAQDKEKLKNIKQLYIDFKEENLISIEENIKQYNVKEFYNSLLMKFKSNREFFYLMIEKLNNINIGLNSLFELEKKIKNNFSVIELPIFVEKRLNLIITEIERRQIFDFYFESTLSTLHSFVLSNEQQRRTR